jgi:diguanylate cyclase (GGDEF)-like protein
VVDQVSLMVQGLDLGPGGSRHGAALDHPVSIRRAGEKLAAPVALVADRAHRDNREVTGAPKPSDETARLAELRALALLDTDPDERFDRVTRLAQRLFGVPIALVSLVDDDRQWFKSRQGLDVAETPREFAFCAHAILDDGVMQVADATIDPRFVDNPLVLGAPEIRFYAGAPISGPGGSKLGTLCIIDREPRVLSPDDEASLRDLADMVEREIAAASLATVDALTGLSNRRGFDALGSKLLGVCARRRIQATLVYLDLDNFKPINDRLGHDVGDAALREFAEILGQAFRGSDVIARLGGDEFAVLMIGARQGPPAIDRLAGLLAVRNTAPGAAYALLASFGVATFDPAALESLADLSTRADAAMYQEKRRRAGMRGAGSVEAVAADDVPA